MTTSQQPQDEPYQVPARPSGPFVRVVCGCGRVFGPFGRLDGRWTAVRSADEGAQGQTPAGGSKASRWDYDSPRRGGVFATRIGWRVWCPACGQDARIRDGKLDALMDGLVAADLDQISLDTLTKAAQC